MEGLAQPSSLQGSEPREWALGSFASPFSRQVTHPRVNHAASQTFSAPKGVHAHHRSLPSAPLTLAATSLLRASVEGFSERDLGTASQVTWRSGPGFRGPARHPGSPVPHVPVVRPFSRLSSLPHTAELHAHLVNPLGR